MKTIELDFNTNPITCPICESKVAGGDGDEMWKFTPCEHTLFIATDEGFEYRSDRFNNHMKIKPEDDVDEIMEASDDGIDGFTSKAKLVGAIKYAIYSPAGGAWGAYYGFAPLPK